MQPGAMTGDSAFLQRSTYVQAPGETLDSSAMPSQATADQSMPNQAAQGQSMPNQRVPNDHSGGSSATHYQQPTASMPRQYPQQQQQFPQQQQHSQQQQQIGQTHRQLSGDQQQQQQQQQPMEAPTKDAS